MDNQHEPDGLDGQGAAVEPNSGGHALFLLSDAETGPDLRKIEVIQIIRTIPGTNITETCPYVWKASELQGWDQVVELYGGGQYTAIGFEKKSHRITARSRPHYFASPPPKPFVPVGNAAPTATVAQPNSLPQQPVPVQAAPSGMNHDFASLVHAMVESNTKLICKLAENSQRPQESSLGEILRGVVVPLIERQHQPPPQQNTLEVVKEIVPLIRGNGNGDSPKSGGANYERGIERGIEYGQMMAGAAAPPKDDIDFGQILGLLKSLTGASQSPPPPPPPPAPPPPPPPAPPNYGYAMPALPPPPPGWEWAHTPMGIVMRPIASVQPMPQQYAPQQYAPQQYAPPPVPPAPPPPPAAIPPQYAVPAPMPVQPAPVHAPPPPPPAPPESMPAARKPVSPEPPVHVPLVSNSAPIPFSTPNVPLRQPLPSTPIITNPLNLPITESTPITEFVLQRRTPKGGAPYLAAAGFIHGAPDNPIAAALGDGAALLQDPEFMQKAAAFMAGDLSPDKLTELLAAAEKAGGK